MLTTSPACSARQRSSRIVRASTLALCPSLEICPDAGSTHQSPTRSFEKFMVSEVFRVFQTAFRTSRNTLAIVNASRAKSNSPYRGLGFRNQNRGRQNCYQQVFLNRNHGV